MHRVEVVRDRHTTLGPGRVTIYDGDDVALGTFECVTGGNQLNPRIYAGITPPINWKVTEPIENRQHPRGHRQTMARIYPESEEDRIEYEKGAEGKGGRTFALDGVPFMVHAGSKRVGASTGCVAVVERWQSFIDLFNRAYAVCQAEGGDLIVEVFDADRLDG